MTTAATITANLNLNSDQFQRGMKNAAKATGDFQKKYEAALQRIAASTKIYNDIGNRLTTLGKKMTTFITLPIVGFLALIIKKAMDADTALGKMAKDSLSKLNDQLLILGTKFLPLVITMIDKLTKGLEWFNNLPPGMQTTITMIIALVALAGPIATFAGTISTLIGWFKGLQFVIVALQPSLITLGTTLWTALAPLLPILALIAAAVLLVYLLWKNWDQLGETISQLAAIAKYDFEQIGAVARNEAEKIQTTWEQLMVILKVKSAQGTAAIAAGWATMITKIKGFFAPFVTWVNNAWIQIGNIFRNVFSGIASFFNSVVRSIINGINWIIDAVNALGAALANLVLPDALTPGSPTPFEMGLRGISTAMDQLSRQSIPEMNRSFAAPEGVSTVGTGRVVNYTDNRRFAAGMDAAALRTALDARFNGLTRELEIG